MSVKQKIADRKKTQGVFGVIAGTRLAGKSTIAGTLPGKTLMLQASVLETGSRSASKLAKRNGFDLTIKDFGTIADLIKELNEAEGYDHIFIDGISAVTEMRLREPDVAATIKRDQWAGYRLLSDTVRSFLMTAKQMATEDGVNVFITLALTETRNANGEVAELKPAVKGNVALVEISRLAPVFVTLTAGQDEDGNTVRELITKTTGPIPGRLDSLLDDENVGFMPADLGALLELIKE